MSANVETMFYVREAPWHGLGTCVESALCSEDALVMSGLNWKVIQRPIMTDAHTPIPGWRANIRETDNHILGVVTDRYRVVQNSEAFAFTDDLLGEGVTYETAGSLQDGKKVWLLARLPEKYRIQGEEIEPYLVFSNAHDGSGAIKVAMTPIRVVCNNTLNLALSTARRMWSTVHTGDIALKLDEARSTLQLASAYMSGLDKEIARLSGIRLSEQKVMEYIEQLFPLEEAASEQRIKNVLHIREDLMYRYFEASDLTDLDHNGYRFVNAVSDFATHAEPLRLTSNYHENMFAKTIGGNPLIDRAHELVLAAG